MPYLEHKSALATHYDQEAAHYDLFNESSSAVINAYLTTLLRQHNVKTILDLACGTGSQVF